MYQLKQTLHIHIMTLPETICAANRFLPDKVVYMFLLIVSCEDS